jgi:hypothetical protein
MERCPLPTAQRLGQSFKLVGHVRHALWTQVSYQRCHGSMKGVQRILYAVVFQQPQHAITIRCASDIHSSFGQCMHGGERAYEPGSVWEIETMAPGLESCMMYAIVAPCTFRTSPRMAQCLQERRVHTTHHGTSSGSKVERRAVDIEGFSVFQAQVPWTCSRHLQGTPHFTVSHLSAVGITMRVCAAFSARCRKHNR